MSLVTITEGSLTCLVSSRVLILIVHHQLHSQMKRRDRISLVLCSILLLVTNIRTLLGDLYELDFDTSSCVIHGYFTLATICTLYYGFVVQLSISSALDEDAETAFAVSGCLPSLPHRALYSTMLPGLLVLPSGHTRSVSAVLRVALPAAGLALYSLPSERTVLLPFGVEPCRRCLDGGFHVFHSNWLSILHVRENSRLHPSPVAHANKRSDVDKSAICSFFAECSFWSEFFSGSVCRARFSRSSSISPGMKILFNTALSGSHSNHRHWRWAYWRSSSLHNWKASSSTRGNRIEWWWYPRRTKRHWAFCRSVGGEQSDSLDASDAIEAGNARMNQSRFALQAISPRPSFRRTESPSRRSSLLICSHVFVRKATCVPHLVTRTRGVSEWRRQSDWRWWSELREANV